MVVILFADGFTETDGIVSLEILRRAGVDVKTVGVDKYTILSERQFKIKTDILIDDIEKQTLEMIILPGGLTCSVNFIKNAKVRKLIKFANIAKVPIAAFGTAPILLGELNVLSGKTAVCYPGMEEYLMGAKLSDKPMVVDGNVITVKGPAFVFLAGFKLLEILKGKSEAKKVKECMLYEGR